jgi:hypothetical protein
MELIFDEIKVGVEEIFFYDPHVLIMNICHLCARKKDCPVPDKDIVRNCNSYEWVETKTSPSIPWTIIQGMTLSNENHAYVSNCTS